MSRVLLTHIGKPRQSQENAKNALVAEYATTTYALNDHRFTTPMMGFGLADATRPDRVVMLGTTGSAWSSLVGVSLNLGYCPEADMDSALTLMGELEALEAKDVMTPAWLTVLSERLTHWLQVAVKCQLTPYLERTPRRDTATYLKALDEVIKPCDQLAIDVTHGLRYHPMLALLAAQYFGIMKNTTLEAIYYGAFDRKSVDDITPVLRLDGMLDVLDWVQALNSFDKDGDYGVFAGLLEQDAVPQDICASMRQAAYFERVTNASQAKQKLTPLRQYTFDADTQPLAELFASALKARTDWASVSSRGNAELRLAEEYLARGDYLRAVIYAQEGYISKRIDLERGDPNDFDHRDEISKGDDLPNAFRTLKKLRNTLVHGLRNKDHKLARQQQDEKSLKNTIKQLIGDIRQG